MKGKSRTDLVSIHKPNINIASLYTSFQSTAKDNKELLNIILTTKPNKYLNPKSYFIFWNKQGEKIRDLLDEGECLRALPLDFIELGLDSILPHLGISDNLMSNYYSVLLGYPDFFSMNRAKQDFIQISPLENEKCLGYLTLTGLLKDDNHSLLSYNERYRLCATYLLARLGYSFEDIYIIQKKGEYNMWYVKLNGNILPTPYQRFEDCMEEVRRLQNTMVAVCVDAVLI